MAHAPLVVPHIVVSGPGGQYAEQCRAAPITRIPAALMHWHVPSAIDYAAASPSLHTEAEVHWDGVPADHALVVTTSQAAFSWPASKRKAWRCIDELACSAFLADQVRTLGAHDFVQCASAAQDMFEARKTRKQRRGDRMPAQLRATYERIRATTNEHDRQAERSIASVQRKEWLAEVRRQKILTSIADGRVLNRYKQVVSDKSGHGWTAEP